MITSATTTQQEYDRRQATLTIARAQLTQSLADVYQIRVSLGLPAQPEKGDNLAEVPPDLDQTFSSVLQARASWRALVLSAPLMGIAMAVPLVKRLAGKP